MRTLKLTAIAVAAVLGLGVSAASADIVFRGSVTTETTPRYRVVQQDPDRYQWVEGRWDYQQGRWVWIEGYWHDRYAQPQATRVYHPPVYTEPTYSNQYQAGQTYVVEQPRRARPGWRWVEGHWERRGAVNVWVDGHWVKARRANRVRVYRGY